eukprot:scaffold44817_cov59-Phaeocystis_antarctica.AAC.1
MPVKPRTPRSPEDAAALLETGGEHGGGWDGEPSIPDEAAGANWNDLREDDDAAEIDLIAQSPPTPKAPTPKKSTPKKPEGAFDQARLDIRPPLVAVTKQSPRLVIVEAEVAAAAAAAAAARSSFQTHLATKLYPGSTPAGEAEGEDGAVGYDDGAALAAQEEALARLLQATAGLDRELLLTTPRTAAVEVLAGLQSAEEAALARLQGAEEAE